MQLRHPQYQKPELLATGPNQVWSWDITKLLGPPKWTVTVLVVRRMYCFDTSVPDSRPPPVSFSPPKAPLDPGGSDIDVGDPAVETGQEQLGFAKIQEKIDEEKALGHVVVDRRASGRLSGCATSRPARFAPTPG
jgi:hypothetical protein